MVGKCRVCSWVSVCTRACQKSINVVVVGSLSLSITKDP